MNESGTTNHAFVFGKTYLDRIGPEIEIWEFDLDKKYGERLL
jgi:hypothetical protein